MTSSGDLWDALLEEADREVLGTLWLSEVRRTVALVVRRYPPSVYSDTGAWAAESLEDVVQDVVVDQLLAAGQLAYILDVARTLDHARALLTRATKRSLALRRTRTVIDNLLERCRSLATSGETGLTSSATRSATEVEIRNAGAAVAQLPRIAVNGGDRAPQVFTTETLERALQTVHRCVPHGYSLRELGMIFEMALTDHLPSALVVFDGVYDEPDRSLTPEEVVIVERTVDEAFGSMDEVPRLVLALKIADWSDSAIGAHLNQSRPTVAKIRREASRQMRDQVEGLQQRLQDSFVQIFAHKLLESVSTIIDSKRI